MRFSIKQAVIINKYVKNWKKNNKSEIKYIKLGIFQFEYI